MYVSLPSDNAYRSPQIEKNYQKYQDELSLSDRKLEKFSTVGKEKVMEAKNKIEMLKQRYMKREEEKSTTTQKTIKISENNSTKKYSNQQMTLTAAIKVDNNSKDITNPLENYLKSLPNIKQLNQNSAQLLFQQLKHQMQSKLSTNNNNQNVQSIQNRKKWFYKSSQQMVYQILARKLESKKQEGKRIQSDLLEETDVDEPISPEYLPKNKNICLPYDQQYADYQGQRTSQSDYSKVRSIEQQIMLWLNHPQALLADYVPRDSFSITKKTNQSYVFTSKNSFFNPLISSMITQFVLKSNSGLSQTQKNILYNLSLQYFYSNANQLSSQFLILLIKLGQVYLSKYSLFFQSNIENYCHTIINNKEIFSSIEKQMVVSYFADQKQLNCQQIACLLLVYPNEKLLTLINTKSFKNSKDILLILASLHFACKQTRSYNGAYFKLINSLLGCISLQRTTFEEILHHVNTLNINQRQYHIHKQVKLRLIGIVSQDHKQKVQEDVAAKMKEINNSGFIGYWSKAVNKIKMATNINIDKAHTQKKKPANLQKTESTLS